MNRLGRSGIVVAESALGALVVLTLLAGLIPATVASATTPVFGASSLVASRCGPARLGGARRSLDQQLFRRTTRLARLTSRVKGARSVSAADRATLKHDLADEMMAITALIEKARSARSCGQLRTERRAMVLDYRVFSVMTPQVDLTLIADEEAVVTTKLAGYEVQITRAITAASRRGDSTGAEEAAAAKYRAAVSAAQQGTAGLPARLLAQTPAGGSSTRATFVAGRIALQRGRSALKAAVAALRAVVAGSH